MQTVNLSANEVLEHLNIKLPDGSGSSIIVR